MVGILCSLCDAKILANELDATVGHINLPKPPENVQYGDNKETKTPQPHEDINFFIEHINR